MRSRVSLQIERIIETFAAKCAQIPFDVRMAFHVSIQQPLQCKRFRTYVTSEFIIRIIVGNRLRWLFAFVVGCAAVHLTDAAALRTAPMAVDIFDGQRIFDAMTAIDEFQLHFGGQAKLWMGKQQLITTSRWLIG